MNNTSSSAAANSSAYEDQFTALETVFYLGNGALGAVFNFLVLFIAFRYVDMEDKPRQIIVVNMTMADFLFCVVYVLTRPFLTAFPRLSCKFYYVTIWTIQLCSCFNLLWLNLDKLIFIQFPLHYYQLVNRKRMLVLSAITWISLISGSVLLATKFMGIGETCIHTQMEPSSYLPICIVYVILILASFACSAFIYVIAHTTTRMESVARTQMLRRLLFLFSSTLWTFFTCLPYRVLYLIVMIAPDLVRESNVYRVFTNGFFKVLVVGIVFNPIITIVTQYIYRNRVLALCGMQKRRNNGEMDTVISQAPRKQSTKILLEGIPLTSKMN